MGSSSSPEGNSSQRWHRRARVKGCGRAGGMMEEEVTVIPRVGLNTQFSYTKLTLQQDS